MKVKFLGFGELVSEIQTGTNSLRVGNEYPVLEVFAQAGGPNKFRILFSKVELPALFDSRVFEVSCGHIPSEWQITANVNGSLTLGPEEWSKAGFWEAYMDHEGWAMDLFDAGFTKSIEGLSED